MNKIKKLIKFLTSLFKDQDIVYIPTIGWTYKHRNSTERLLNDIFKNKQRKTFPFYDKDKRWFTKNKKKIITPITFVSKDNIFILVENHQKAKKFKVIHYGKNGLKDREIQKLLGAIKIKNIIIYSFKKPAPKENFRVQNVYFKKINKKNNTSTNYLQNIKYYTELSKKSQNSLSSLGKESELNGFNFLYKKIISKNKSIPKLICAIKNNKIIGAIGPIYVLKDPWNNSWLPSPYFGVKSKFRNQGYGTKLWKAMMRLAYQKKAKYIILETKKNSIADYFYKKQGLKKKKELYLISIKNKREKN